MGYKLQLRHGLAATWTSTNPVLSANEPGIEYDTGRFKVGDGSTTWTSLAYRDVQGATQTLPFRSFGDGSDGNVTISSGTTTLSRDMFYNNLTMSGTGKIVTNGYRIFVKSILDITAAAVGAIQWNGNDGNNASGTTGGVAPSTQPAGATGDISIGAIGASSSTANGTSGSSGVIGNANGGISGKGGSGGTGTSGTGGNGGAARVSTVNNPFLRFETSFLFGALLMCGGTGGSGGGSGAGDGTNVGGAGGSGGNGGGILAIYANAIIKSSSTPAGTFQANGGKGGNGSNSAAAGITGGGAGGGGGSGGWVYLCYNYVYGPSITGLVQANGGNGGTGGNGFGSGASGGGGGDCGSGGRINAINIPLATATNNLGFNNLVISPELTGYTPIINTSLALNGGNGGINGLRTMSL